MKHKQHNNKKLLAALGLAALLAACGGGSSSSGGSNNNNGNGGLVDSGGGSNSGQPAAACAGSPVATTATTYYGVTPAGQVGTWTFDTAARTASYQVGATTGTLTLTRDDTSCTYTSASTGALRTAFVGTGVAVSTAAVGGTGTGALLLANPETTLANVAGTYNVVRFETDASGPAVSQRSSYATLQLNAAGAWQMCPGAAFSAGCGGPSGTLGANGAGGFDLVSGGATLGRVFIKVSGTQKVLLTAFSDAGASVTGMWVGTGNSAFAAGANDGVYVTNTAEATTSLLTLAGLTVKPQARPTAAAILADQPVTGAFEIVTGDPVNDVGLVSGLGFYADITQSTTDAFIRFGVKQVQ